MAKLTISEAAALTQVNRSTLHRAMKQGRLSRDTDGRLDTAELLRAGFQLHAPTPPARATAQRVALPQGRATTQRDATLPPSVAQQAGITASHIEITALQRECALLQQQLDATRTMLQQQLDATRELLQSERQEAQDRERRAADREALLLQMLHEAQLRADRLLEAPRPAPPAPPAAPEVVRELLRRRPYADLPAPGPPSRTRTATRVGSASWRSWRRIPRGCTGGRLGA